MTTQPDNAKHPNTRALITRAIETCGLTQKQIAEICNVQQSVVSGWKAGKIVARWKQVRPLIDKYGDVQGEKTSNTYCRVMNSTYVLGGEVISYLQDVMTSTYMHESSLAANSAEDKNIKAILEHSHSILKDMSKAIEDLGEIRFETEGEVYGFISKFNKGDSRDFYDEFIITKRVQSNILRLAHRYEKEYVKIYGENIFEYTFYAPKGDFKDKYAWMKWSVISSLDGLLTWVVSKQKCDRGITEVDSNHEHAAWVSEIYESIDAEELIRKSESYRFEPSHECFVDRDILLFSLIHAFSKNGYDMEIVKSLGQ
ncbi:transcriptional regulator [Geopsychrobacter electrodiphilus]|uniref:transcriptional regulator n=1 Tax=Geopsychrobacter electrodiphilus TaxID=225196 RepID=UPI000382916C|nr:transcriptional regulator [Geopsychrobacter electrodiphilus]